MSDELTEGQRSHVLAALGASGVRMECVACGNPLSLDVNLYGLQIVVASQVPATAHLRPKGATCVALTCARCGYVQLHAQVGLGLDEMI